jgi:hypothetical protein
MTKVADSRRDVELLPRPRPQADANSVGTTTGLTSGLRNDRRASRPLELLVCRSAPNLCDAVVVLGQVGIRQGLSPNGPAGRPSGLRVGSGPARAPGSPQRHNGTAARRRNSGQMPNSPRTYVATSTTNGMPVSAGTLGGVGPQSPSCSFRAPPTALRLLRAAQDFGGGANRRHPGVVISTRRLRARPAGSSCPLTVSGATGSDSPRPSVVTGRPAARRRAPTASARRRERSRL